jgi:hypothetical protein
MTEAEWLSETSSPSLRLPRSGSGRKLRLFALACCERIGRLIRDERSRAALSFTERHVQDDLTSQKGRMAIQKAAAAAARELGATLTAFTRADEVPARAAATAAEAVAAVMRANPHDAAGVAAHLAAYALAWSQATSSGPGPIYAAPEDIRRDEEKMQLRLVHDIFGNPFRRAAIESWWRSSVVVALTRRIYEERAFDRLPILADALEDAGCDNADMLAHCRSDGLHVRGCWVVDLLLGKE